jgi:WD40-like Beta Propeller Repeat
VDALAVPFGSVVLLTWFTDDVAGSIHLTPPVGGVEADVESLGWSNDGRSLAISMTRRTHAGPGAPESSLWLAADVCTPSPSSCAEARLRRLPYDPGANEYPIFLAGFAFRDRYLLIWPDYIGSGSVALDGLPLKAFPVDGGRAVTIGTTLIRNSWVQSSPDGSRLLVVRSDGRMVTDKRDIEVCDSPTQCRPLAYTLGPQKLDPAWSPDGTRIAFVRNGNGSTYPPVVNGTIDWTIQYRNRTLWIADADGSNGHEITAAGGGVADLHFSPDGSAIVFVRDARLWNIDLATNRVEPVSGSMRLTTSCGYGDCLPDAAVYETESHWSQHEAVNFTPAKP